MYIILCRRSCTDSRLDQRYTTAIFRTSVQCSDRSAVKTAASAEAEWDGVKRDRRSLNPGSPACALWWGRDQTARSDSGSTLNWSPFGCSLVSWYFFSTLRGRFETKPTARGNVYVNGIILEIGRWCILNEFPSRLHNVILTWKLVPCFLDSEYTNCMLYF